MLALASRDSWLAAFRLADTARPGSRQAVRDLQELGVASRILSGDQPETVAALAGDTGIGQFRAAAAPEDKLAHLHGLQQEGRIVLMVGDGVNDAPVLAAANISIAMGGGVDVAHAAGDMVLLGNRIEHIPPAVSVARFTRRIIRENLLWALVYNVCAIPLAVCGYVTPWLASLGMAASSLLVVLNALRISRWKGN